MARQWRCAVVGGGVVGEWHARVLMRLPNTTLAGVCDVSTDRARAMLQKCGIEGIDVYSDLDEMIRRQQVDVVHICTPSGCHLEPSLIAMQAGVNVICEKPLEITLERIDEMIETARKEKVRLACIFQNRWNPANRAIHDAAAEGRFGRLAYAGCTTPWYRTDDYYRQGGWRGSWKLDGGGAIMNQSIHAVDLLQWIAGPVKHVSAYAASRIHPQIEVEDTLTCALQFESGAFGTIVGTTAMYPGGHVRIEIGGENGTALSEDGLKTFAFRDERPADKQLIEQINQNAADAGGATGPQLASLQNHISNVQSILGAWDEKRDADTDGVEARKAIAITLAMYESARRNGQPVQPG